MIQLFRTQGKSAGSRMARLLIGLGHRSVVYISCVHDLSWSRQRLEGVIDQCTKTGGIVHLVQSDLMHDSFERILGISVFDDATIRKVVGVFRTPQQVKDMLKRIDRSKRENPQLEIDPADRRAIQTILSAISNLHGDIAPRVYEQLVPAVLLEATKQLQYATLVPLFKEALAHPDATAWICATDSIASDAQAFLRNANIAVPKAISVVGFDNRPVTTLAQRLTSFDFNAQGLVYSMLSFIARPPRPRGPYRSMPCEVEGIIMERDTTAAAPKQSRFQSK
jgi:DNA-binding LacI/PurR family transcriptional regulator